MGTLAVSGLGIAVGDGTGTTPVACTATSATRPRPNSKPCSTMPGGPTRPWSKSDSASLQRNRCGSNLCVVHTGAFLKDDRRFPSVQVIRGALGRPHPAIRSERDGRVPRQDLKPITELLGVRSARNLRMPLQP